MKICVIGLGYIGLPTSLLLAAAGYSVVGFDVDKKKINRLRGGKVYFKEPKLKKLFKKAKKNFKAIDKIEKSDVFIVCVPTPLKNKKCDLIFVKKAGKDISKVLKTNDVVILESTVPPGTTEGIFKETLEESGLKAGKDFFLSYVSEKAIPGDTIEEMKKNIRVIGAINRKSAYLAKKIYSSFVEGKIILTSTKLAETVKLMENSFRDVNIALANEFQRICDKLNIDVWKAIELANKHPRVNILNPGVGVGGHCLPTDPWFLIENIEGGKLIKISRKINDTQPKYMIKKIKKLIKEKKIKDPTIGILGIGYKPKTDDIRNSPMLKIYKLLKRDNFHVLVADPLIKKSTIKLKSKRYVIEKSNILIDHNKIWCKK